MILSRKGNCSLIIRSNVKDAAIFIDKVRTDTPVDSVISGLTSGKHSLILYKPGYEYGLAEVFLTESDTPEVEIFLREDSLAYKPPSARYYANPAEKNIIYSRRNTELAGKASGETDNQLQYNTVDTEPAEPLSYRLNVNTIPADGDIFINGNFCGRGKVDLHLQNPGEYAVTFGNIDGYSTPSPLAVKLSPRNETAEFTGEYFPVIDIAVNVSAKGEFTGKNTVKITLGSYFPGKEEIAVGEAGPDIVEPVKGMNYALEMGYGYAHRNPPGCDFLEILFNLPENFGKNKPLDLIIESAGSDKTYLLNIVRKNAVEVDINGHSVVKEFSPRYKIDKDKRFAVDKWPVTDFLKPGENTISIKIEEENRCYFYLKSIELK